MIYFARLQNILLHTTDCNHFRERGMFVFSIKTISLFRHFSISNGFIIINIIFNIIRLI